MYFLYTFLDTTETTGFDDYNNEDQPSTQINNIGGDISFFSSSLETSTSILIEKLTTTKLVSPKKEMNDADYYEDLMEYMDE